MPRRLPWLLALAALVALTLASYRPVLDAGFVGFDDTSYLALNPPVADGLRAESVRWALTGVHLANWHPLTWWSHMTDVELFGLEPAGHHVTNLLLHLLNVILAFLVLRALTNEAWPSLFVAGVLALHPANVESVAWVAQRKTLLSTGFALLCIGSYARYVRSGGWAPYVASVLCLGLSLLSKGMFVTMPFLLLLLDYWPLRRPWSRRWLRDKVPFLVISLLGAGMTWMAQQDAISPIDTYAITDRLSNVALSYVRYLGMFFAPVHLAAFYPLFVEDLTPLRVGGSIALLLAISAGTLALARRRPYLIVGWLWFLGTLVPVIGLVQVGMQSIADRYVYVPFLGLTIALAWSVQDLVRSLRVRATATVVGAGAVALFCAYAGLTYRQAKTWHDGQSLFENAIANTRQNWKAHSALASIYLGRGEVEKSIAQSEAATKFHFAQGQVRSTYGLALYQAGSKELAREQFELATQLDPDEPAGYLNLGWYLAEHGEYEQAMVNYLTAETKSTARTPAYMRMMIAANWAGALEKLGRLPQARERYERALAIDPDFSPALRDAARVDLQLGDAKRAADRLRHALEVDPADVEAELLLASATWLAGDAGSANADFERVLATDPTKVGVVADLARKVASAGRPADGRGLLLALLERPPPVPEPDAGIFTSTLRFQLAEIAIVAGDHAAATDELDRALAAWPDNYDANHRLAWLLAMNADPLRRDPHRAVALAERLVGERREYTSLATLGVTYAAAGRATEAIATTREALELARKAQDARAVEMLERRLQEYGAAAAGP